MHRLRPVAHAYPWGSTDGIAGALGLAPGSEPLAELWFGAHPKGPAQLTDEVTLLDHLTQHPQDLGEAGRQRFGDRLPFLLKLLSARTALSIQAHPSREQAAEGFAREDAEGKDLSAPDRNYRDTWPKPEGLLALTPFDALCGFRDPVRTRELIGHLGVAAADDLVAPLDDGRDGLAQVFLEVLTLGSDATATIDELVAAAGQRSATVTDPELADLCDTIVTTARDFPGDPGVLAALLLNRVRLQPGEGLALEAGNVHAYLRGTGVEIMSNSDNVLRGGLTGKHVDVDELARVVQFTSGPPSIVTMEPAGSGLRRFPAPFPEFALWEVTDTELPAGPSPRIVLSLAAASITDAEGTVDLSPGDAVFVPAGADAKVSGRVLLASHAL